MGRDTRYFQIVKFFLFLVVLSFFCPINNARAQGAWNQKADFGGIARFNAVGFSIGSKGYIGTGMDDSYIPQQDFWEYNSITNAWTQKANFNGGARSGAVGFSIGDKGFVGTGINISSQKQNDFWQYNPSSNTWLQKANFGGGVRTAAVGFSIGSKGYIGTGSDSVSNFSNDFWEYDTTSNSWTRKANFAQLPRRDAVGLSLGGKGYIGTGEDTAGLLHNDLLEYDQASNSWASKGYFGVARRGATGFTIGTKCYIGLGNNASTYYKDFWEFDTADSLLRQLADYKNGLGAFGTWGACAFAIGNKGYIGVGKNGGSSVKEFWQFNPWSYVFTASDDSVCSSTSSITFNNGTTDSDAKYYKWNFYTPGYEDTTILYDTLTTSINYTFPGINGTHSVTMIVYDSNNVLLGTYSKSIYISHYDSVAVTSLKDTCTGAVGSATANAYGGVVPYSYTWAGNGSSAVITALSSATYTVTVMDKIGCTITGTTLVGTYTSTVNAQLTAQADTCTGNVGIVMSNPSGGTIPYSYLWSNSASSQTITGLSAGIYSVTVSDKNGCTKIDSVAVGTFTSSINAQMTVKSDTCIGNVGTVIGSPVGGAAPYNYLWSNNENTQVITGLSPGTYSVVVTDKNGCTVLDSASVGTFTSSIVIAFTSTEANCNSADGSIKAIPSGGTEPYSYSWSNNGATQVISNIAAGNYSITVTDKNGCIDSNTYTLLTSTTISAPDICMVTVDSLSKNNVIIWNKTLYQHVDSFIVYRETGTNTYQPIGAVPYSTLSIFTDTTRTKYFPNTGDPNAGTYRYKLQIKDSCGNYSALSNFHNTIFIINNNGTFSWPQLYTIEGTPNPVNSYVLMRDDNSTGVWNAVNSIAGTQQVITDPAYSAFQNTASWRVETFWGISCSPSLKEPGDVSFKNNSSENYEKSLSNIYNKIITTTINETGEHFKSLDIHPNPFSAKATIVFSFGLRYNKLKIKIIDYLGREVSVQKTDNGNFELERGNLESGIYVLMLYDSERLVAKRKFAIVD